MQMRGGGLSNPPQKNIEYVVPVVGWRFTLPPMRCRNMGEVVAVEK